VPFRTKIAASAICACIIFGSKCCASARKGGRRKAKTNSSILCFRSFVWLEIFYSELEKIAYAVIMAARKLRHYFEGHRIRVITNQPLNDLFTNREASTRIIKWGAESQNI
jgi:hypothetical protein